jgi:hypothetical protein
MLRHRLFPYQLIVIPAIVQLEFPFPFSIIVHRKTGSTNKANLSGFQARKRTAPANIAPKIKKNPAS